MLNQAIVVGTVIENFSDDYILINSTHNYKNIDGNYDSSIIKILLPIKLKITRHIQIEQIVAIKGFLKSNNNTLEFIAERISVLQKN